jgi:hypothetical protein
LTAKELEKLLQRLGKTPEIPGTAHFKAPGNGSIESWKLNEIRLAMDSPHGGVLQVSQFYFPGWSAALESGIALEAKPSIPGGLVSVSVPPGKHLITITRRKTSPEIIGAVVSVVALGVLLLMVIRTKREKLQAWLV